MTFNLEIGKQYFFISEDYINFEKALLRYDKLKGYYFIKENTRQVIELNDLICFIRI